MGKWVVRDYVYKAAGGVPATAASLWFPTPGSTLASPLQQFLWNYSGASLYQVCVGNTFGSCDLGAFPEGGTTATLTYTSGLPTDGRTLYVRLYSNVDGRWIPRDYTYISGP